MIKGCILPWIHLHGDVKGNYHLCCHIPPSSNPIGNHTEPISTIFNNDAYKEVRKLFLSGKLATNKNKFVNLLLLSKIGKYF